MVHKYQKVKPDPYIDPSSIPLFSTLARIWRTVTADLWVHCFCSAFSESTSGGQCLQKTEYGVGFEVLAKRFNH